MWPAAVHARPCWALRHQRLRPNSLAGRRRARLLPPQAARRPARARPDPVRVAFGAAVERRTQTALPEWDGSWLPELSPAERWRRPGPPAPVRADPRECPVALDPEFAD